MGWLLPVAMAVGGAGLGFMSGKKRSTNPYGTLNPEQVKLTQALGPYFQSKLNSPSGYTGQYTAPLTAEEQGSLDEYSRLNALRGTTLQDLLNVDESKLNEDFTNYVERPATSYFQRNILPYMEEQFPAFSTARMNASGRAWSDVAGNLSTQRYQSIQDAKNRALTASDALNSMGTTSMALYSIPRSIQQLGLDKAYAEYVRGNESQQNSINQMLNFLGISTGTYQPDTRLETMLAGLGAGANMGLGIENLINSQNLAKSQQDYYDRLLKILSESK